MTIVHRLLTRRLAVQLPVAVTVGFGHMAERTALLVGLEDADGTVGWGEVFANWPPGGAAHRENLLRAVFAPLVEDRPLDEPGTWGSALHRATHRLRLQCDEPGPFDQCLAGLDLAAWHPRGQADDRRRLASGGSGAGTLARVPRRSPGVDGRCQPGPRPHAGPAGGAHTA